HQVAHNAEVIFGQLRDVKDKLLSAEVRQESIPEIAAGPAHRSRMHPGAANAGEDANTVWRQNLPPLGKGMIADQIVEHVVTLIGLGEIFLGVIDHVVGADRFYKIDIARAANGG